MPQSHYSGIPVKDHKGNLPQSSNEKDKYKTVADDTGKRPHQWGFQRHRSLTTNGLAKDNRTERKDDQAH